MAATSRDEPGCADYRFAIDIDDPPVVRNFERWESAAALEAALGFDEVAPYG